MSRTTVDSVASTTRSAHGTRVSAAIAALPDFGLLPFLWLCLAITVANVFHVFHPLVLAAALIATVLTWRWRLPAYSEPLAWQSSLLAVLIVIAWVVVNLPFAGEWIDLPRDSAFLNQAGIWLSGHMSPNLPVGFSADVVDAVPGAMIESNAYHLRDGELQIQGAKLLPGLIAIPGWLWGVRGVLAGNVVIGGFALLCFYGFARRFVGPKWSLGALVALAVTVPMAYFSRTAFTEPLMLAAVFGGLTVLWVALGSGDRRHYLFGGALIGACGLARIDGALVVIGLIIALAMATASYGYPVQRRNILRGGSAARVGAFAVVLLGLVEMSLNSLAYVAIHVHVALPMLMGLVSAFILGEIVSTERVSALLRRSVSTHRGQVAAGLLVAGAVFTVALLSRPLWFVARQERSNPSIADAQSSAGLPIEADRTYAELSLHWLSLYLGWAIVLVGLVGLVVGVSRVVLDSDRRLLVVLCVLGAPTILYLLQPSIVPDQIWAQRRFLATAIPALVLFAAWTLKWLGQVAGRVWPRRRVVMRVALGGLFVASLISPLLAWGPMFTVREHGGRLAQAVAVCAAVDGRPTVVLDRYFDGYVATLRTVCGVDAVSFIDPVTESDLRAAVRAFGGGPVALVAFESHRVPWVSSQPPEPITTHVTQWPIALNRRAEPALKGDTAVWVGTIRPDGTVDAVE